MGIRRDEGVARLLLLLGCVALQTSAALAQSQQTFRSQPLYGNRGASFAAPALTQAAPAPAPVVSQPPATRDTFRYNPASAAVTELARLIGSILGQQSKAAVFSPVSIACALSLMLLGAEAKTKDELIQVLGFEQYRNHLHNIHQLYSDMLKDLARTEFDRRPPHWRTSNPCYDDDDEEDAAAAAAEFPLQKDVIRVTNRFCSMPKRCHCCEKKTNILLPFCPYIR